MLRYVAVSGQRAILAGSGTGRKIYNKGKCVANPMLGRNRKIVADNKTVFKR
jgi:hypothetical protein